ncbi:MAG: divergent polysaccharide deacetylase family protein [Rhodospirillales bacterium]|nr:divergent polysaccharide deacetylase family protein [Rhodospirillales bacterium]
MTERVPGQLRLPILEARQPLAAAPAPGLVQSSGLGSLPIISTDGRQPWKIYSRPFDKSNKMPRIALVITGLGLSSAATNIAIQSLPGTITLAFAPYAERLHEWVRLARTAGHEVMLNVPMEPDNYPEYDPGPQTLLTSLSPQENVERLLWTLSRTTGYVGVVDFMGSRFTTSRTHLRPILKMLKKRGLMFLDSNSAARSLAPVIAAGIGIPFAANTRFIDAKAARFAIDKQLGLLEVTAKKKKMAIGMGSPYPVTLERIANWVKELKKRGYVLAPVSAMVKQKK